MCCRGFIGKVGTLKIQGSLSEIFMAVRFGLVGAGATVAHLVVSQSVLAAGLAPVQIANVIGFLVALVAGFLGHHHFSFRGRAPFGRAFRRYGVIALCGFLANNVILFALVAADVVSQKTALTIAILAIPAATFLASRFWGFSPALPGQDPSDGGSDKARPRSMAARPSRPR